ncbi:MAG TPA: M1 family metallopeptidase [Woeseiaceae bacterium]|nr:M1 family metallopeptidase [Woeseiaceae bacterium]
MLHSVCRRLVGATMLFVLWTPGATFADIPESTIRYSIEVRLDPATRDLHGQEAISWTNTLREPVTSIPMHLYLNAFSNEASTWNRDTLSDRFGLAGILERFPDPWGWTEPTSIRQNGNELAWQAIAPDDGNHLDRSLIEVQLAAPVAPGETLTLDVSWQGRLPAAAARTGGYKDFFFVAQWFPKIAGVKPEGEFNRHQFFGVTEFFADFADYEVRIGIPEHWGIAATGKGRLVESSDGVDWHEYRQRGVIDFAFTTGADMVNIVTPHALATGGTVDIHIFQPQGFDHQVPRWVAATAAALDSMSTRIMPYPYETVSVVLPPMAGLRSLGMEYPTLFTGGPGGRIWDDTPLKTTHANESVIAHEFAHQYFMGLMASNEFEDAFMDEGMTEYWTVEIMAERWGEKAGGGELFGRPIDVNFANLSSRPVTESMPAVWSGPSFLARGFSIGRQFYDRPATTMQTAARLFGQDTVDAIFAAYASRWAFRHPRMEDFWAVADDVAGADVAALLREAYLRPAIPDYKVVSVAAEKYSAPRGYVRTDDAVVYVGPDRGDDKLLGLDPVAAGMDDRVALDIVDPGHTRDVRVMGGIERRLIAPQHTAADDDYMPDEESFYVSKARIEGPDWDNLPVTVRLRFADGAVVEDEWNGKGVYREYRAVRAAPLDSVIIDPDYRIRLDIVPVNNGLSREAKGVVPGRWSRWVAAVFQAIAEGAASWL